MKNKIMIAGGGGREAAFAARLAADCAVTAVMSHENPTIMRCIQDSGGAYCAGDAADPQVVAAFAEQQQPDYVFVSADDPLANGVTDELLARGFRAVGGSRAAARIEWDKIYAMRLMREECPAFTPFHLVVSAPDEAEDAVAAFRARGLEVVVKPQGLTGGKGVRVMPAHLPTYESAADYARALLNTRGGEQALLVEKLHGPEFTIMGLTDGEHLVMAPATYDYPYRFAGDRGPGTGGMGCLTAAAERLPFMTAAHLEDCRAIMQKILDRMRADGVPFNGALNGGFFLTADGVRFMEFNSRFGDPEAINIMMLLETPLSQVIEDIWHKRLTAERARFRPQASVVKYLVAKEYPDASAAPLDFDIDEAALQAQGIAVYYASCVRRAGGGFRTLKKSRVAALAMPADSPAPACERINAAIAGHVRGALEYRADIGSAAEMSRLAAGG